MSLVKFFTETIDTYRPSTTLLPNTLQATETRPTLPYLSKVPVLFEPFESTIEQLVTGWEARKMFRLYFRTEDIVENDLIYSATRNQWFVVKKMINDSFRRYARYQMAILEQRTTSYP